VVVPSAEHNARDVHKDGIGTGNVRYVSAHLQVMVMKINIAS